MRLKQEFAQSHDAHVFNVYRKRFAGGVGTYPLIGTPARIVEEMVKMADIGFAGCTVSFVNFHDELPYFIDKVLPLMIEAGLREKIA
jgi:alkanesulfonate monooxygenase SsuD/methylene tetrahydromethanopterin reductase-like flavin-dependent oxidoreductase (luciferase family)